MLRFSLWSYWGSEILFPESPPPPKFCCPSTHRSLGSAGCPSELWWSSSLHQTHSCIWSFLSSCRWAPPLSLAALLGFYLSSFLVHAARRRSSTFWAPASLPAAVMPATRRKQSKSRLLLPSPAGLACFPGCCLQQSIKTETSCQLALTVVFWKKIELTSMQVRVRPRKK